MSRDLNPQKALIFRIVHIGNIGHVLAKGCYSRTLMESQPYVAIGNPELIEKRNDRVVPCGPGGRLGDYVPFYFTFYTPMLYNIKTGYGVTKHSVSKILILVSSLHRLVKKGIPFVFTDRHAYLKAARFSDDLVNLDWIIWTTLQQRDFKKDDRNSKKDDVDKFEKYQAEALIYKHVSGSHFGNRG